MKKVLRHYLTAFAATALLAGVTPAMAGPAENAFLERLVGIYQGTGQVTGGQRGTVNCPRLTVLRSQESASRLIFNGRCTLPGSTQTQGIRGIIRYNDETKAFEASSQGDTVAGRRSGQSLVFNISGSDSRGSGSSVLTFSPGSIQVQFEFVDARSGEPSKGSIRFGRS